MKRKEAWINQVREVREPWSIHAVVTKERRVVQASGTLYADWVPNQDRSFEIMPVTITDGQAQFIGQVKSIVQGLGHIFTSGDAMQMSKALTEVKDSFNQY